MAVLGKRKASEATISEEDASEIFRRHFESQFEPLAPKSKTATSRAEDEDEDTSSNEDDEINDGDNSEWGGLSDENEVESEEEADSDSSPIIEVVDHSISQNSTVSTMSKRELKQFMSSRPPDQTTTSEQPVAPTSTKSKALPEDAPSLLAQDLELRRLLAESHLLNPSHRSAASPFSSGPATPKTFAAGRTRQKATDMRIQALGSKTSILKQEKMPMSMRKGMTAAAGARESKRRREAKENGVILERTTTLKKSTRPKNKDRGVDGPGLGKFKGAELKLNKNDIKKMEGGRDVFGRKSRR